MDVLLWDDDDDDDDDDELMSLISKENETNPCFGDQILDGVLMSCRKEALDWVLRVVKSDCAFSSLTMVLAVNYFDRFIASGKFQADIPWMSRLVGVACLSLASKVENIRGTLLIDLKVEEARYVFEAKTIQRMELLILSTLQWRMHPVTPVSFFSHIIRRFGSKCHQQLEFFRQCEYLLISVVTDTRFMSCIPSVLASAIVIYVVKDLKGCDEVDCQSQLTTLLKSNQEKVNECYKLLLEHNSSKKGSSSTTPEPLFKRRRLLEQKTRSPSINPMFLDVLSSPH